MSDQNDNEGFQIVEGGEPLDDELADHFDETWMVADQTTDYEEFNDFTQSEKTETVAKYGNATDVQKIRREFLKVNAFEGLGCLPDPS